MKVAVTLAFYEGLSENQGGVAGSERQISDKQTVAYHRWPGF